jgi:C4-dicarboxylate-specific signal transduction histidine kinase
MDSCSHRASGKNCPISKTPCLGECIYASILDDISLGIIGMDMQKELVFFQNKVAIEIFKDTIPPKDYRALSSLLLQALGDCFASGYQPVPQTVQYGKKFIGYTVYRIADHYLWIYASDVTEKMRLDAIAESVNTMNDLGYIFSGIRHELGNPVNSMKTTITVLKNNIRNYTSDMVVEYIDRVMSDIHRVEYLLKELKTFSMFEHPEIRNVDMVAFMKDLFTMVERDFEPRGIRFKMIFRPEVGYGHVDPRAFQQVMLNILTNAADALEGRGSPEIAVTMFKSAGRILVKVKDNGCGMTGEYQKNLFKPFTTSKTNGTGLGLVIAKKMMSKMDGTVEVESKENLGTVVTLNLPEG